MSLNLLASAALASILVVCTLFAVNNRPNRPLGLVERMDKVEAGVIHRGMIVPYFGKDLPAGYVWADGKERWPNEGWVPVALRNDNVPNLNGRVLRGDKTLGRLGGSDRLTDHYHALPDHTHNLGGVTGWCTSRDGRVPPMTMYRGDRIASDCHVVHKGPAHPNGQHAHALPARTGGVHRANPQDQLRSGGVFSPDDRQQIPSFVGVRYIIRIR